MAGNDPKVQEKEINELHEQRKVSVQGELLTKTLKMKNLWNSYITKDPVWLSFPVEMRNYIEGTITKRNENIYTSVESTLIFRHIHEKLQKYNME